MTWLVISDLDGTLLGDDGALRCFAAWHDTMRERVLLAYSSGRSFESIVESIEATHLPEPVAIIGNVGTQICRFPSGKAIPGWPVTSGTWSVERVHAALAGVAGLQTQPDEFQSAHKVSFYLHDASHEQLADLRRRLDAARLTADIVYSSQRDLDVLPQGANKGTAARFLARSLSIPDQRVIVCGDTGNDVAMFRSGFRGVIVGNALPELKALACADAYQAQCGYAQGVLEGMQHWIRS